MKVSEQWLREWVDPPCSSTQLAEQLTVAGLEVESIQPVAGRFSGVKVGRIIQIYPHPNASRLQVCEVDIGEERLLSIVCGASNVRAELKVAVACIGAQLADNKIKEVRLRGVLSQGMLCSRAELGLASDSTGIFELPFDAPLGQDLHDYLRLHDQCMDIHITPNRGDCLSVQGLAREIAVLSDIPLKGLSFPKITPVTSTRLPITVECPEDCPRYVGRVIQGINLQASTPIWLSERLRRSGFRSIHPVVDVTNYVLLELGQPLHAFDLASIDSEIIVRRAYSNECLVLLDEKEVKLDKETLVIADETKVHAMAGVMGALSSSVSATTSDIFLESAFFRPSIIAGRTRHYGLTSEAAYRFERGVDPNITVHAMERATQLLLEIVGGSVGPVLEIATTKERKTPPIPLRHYQIERLLGLSLRTTEIEAILKRLGMDFITLGIREITWEVIPPSWRFDISLEADLIEELARVHGYSRIPNAFPRTELRCLASPESELALSRVRKLLVDRDYHEAITYSFIAPDLQKIMDPEACSLSLVNPLSSELSVMRTSLWPGLVNAVLYNQKRQQSRIRLFETGLCFQSSGETLTQTPYLAAIATGTVFKEQWGVTEKPLDFFNIKSDIEALFQLTGQLPALRFIPATHPALHPGQSCSLMLGEKQIGYLGALHPEIRMKRALSGPIYLFELVLSASTQARLPFFIPFSRFPFVRRDLSFWIEKKISVEALLSQIKSDAGPWLKEVYLFDRYPDKNRKKDQSLAFALLWQHPERTLVDSEVEEALSLVVQGLQANFPIHLRK